VGYFRRDSNELIDVNTCPVLTPGVQSALEFVREDTGWNMLWSDEPQVEAASGDDGRISIYSADRSEPAAELSVNVNNDTYRFTAETFFQANKFLVGELIETAVGDASGETALDLYAGVGLFALPLSRRFASVVAVEEHTAAAAFARKNAAGIGAENISVVNRSVAGYLAENQNTAVDLMLIDPPRSGPEARTVELITSMRPASLVYVSCEPSILARDLTSLLAAGYSIEKITAIDLFPQTHHVETVVRLTI
jgi:23S rRNA (uracil1939-C5)-methyltransferase